MRQGVLAGLTGGLRPSQRRRLDRLLHRRQPSDAVAERLSLERLAEEAAALGQPLTLVVDEQGLCRLLWIGGLDHSDNLLSRLPGSTRRRGRGLRLITCTTNSRQSPLEPGEREAIVALDLAPTLWLRFPSRLEADGQRKAALFVPGAPRQLPMEGQAWSCRRQGFLTDLCGLDPADLVEEKETDTSASRHRGEERVLLLVLEEGLPLQDGQRTLELEGLVRSAGGQPVGAVKQRRRHQNLQSIWGEGKLREAALTARRLQADLVVTDRELTPSQVRTLERLLDRPVSDRSEVILDIFAQRAASGAGRLQVELAQLRYRLPRLSGRGLALSRQGGGIGTRGPGETQLEKDRRAIARRIERLQRDVRQLGAHRARLREARRSIPHLALVGYTNAGKSSLLNALTRSGGASAVLAEDKLFATLDPSTRRISLAAAAAPAPVQRLLTDTVGFIRELPPALVEAFRSTIEEALAADGLLLVVNLADTAWPEQLSTVHGLLDDLGSSIPRQVIGNQIDRCPSQELERARALDPAMLFVSATAGLGLQRLRQHLCGWPGVPASTSTNPPSASVCDDPCVEQTVPTPRMITRSDR